MIDSPPYALYLQLTVTLNVQLPIAVDGDDVG